MTYTIHCLSVSLSLCLSVFLSICVSVVLSLCLSVSLSLCLSVSLSLCLSVALSLCLPVSLSYSLTKNSKAVNILNLMEKQWQTLFRTIKQMRFNINQILKSNTGFSKLDYFNSIKQLMPLSGIPLSSAHGITHSCDRNCNHNKHSLLHFVS